MKNLPILLLFLFLLQIGQAQNAIDATFALDKTTICFIKGDKVVHYDIVQKKVKMSETLQKTFPKLPFDKIDAIWDNQQGKIYVFKDSLLVSFDKKTSKLMDANPQAIGGKELGLALNKIDAAFTWNNGKTFFFSGSKFIQYDLKTAKTDEHFPKKITEELWSKMKFSHIDAACNLENKTYFFSGYQYVVFDIEKQHTDDFSQKICDLPGLCDALGLAPYEGIDFFEGTWKEALMKAKAENKLIFLDAYTSWCKPCKQMAAQIFPLANVGKVYNEKFICLKMNMEQGDGPNLGKVYKITTYPTLLFVNPAGEVLHRTVGALEEADFVELGKSVK